MNALDLSFVDNLSLNCIYFEGVYSERLLLAVCVNSILLHTIPFKNLAIYLYVSFMSLSDCIPWKYTYTSILSDILFTNVQSIYVALK